MAYLKPSATTKIFNNVANSLAMRSTLWDVHTLEVARRNAVDPLRIPVIPLQHNGSLFIVSTRGESDWVKNVRLGQKGSLVTYAVTEVPADEPLGYHHGIPKEGGREVNGYWKKLPEDTDHPTFKLTPN